MFSQGNILKLIEGETYDIFAPPPLLFRLFWFLISLMDMQCIELFGLQLSAI